MAGADDDGVDGGVAGRVREQIENRDKIKQRQTGRNPVRRWNGGDRVKQSDGQIKADRGQRQMWL